MADKKEIDLSRLEEKKKIGTWKTIPRFVLSYVSHLITSKPQGDQKSFGVLVLKRKSLEGFITRYHLFYLDADSMCPLTFHLVLRFCIRTTGDVKTVEIVYVYLFSYLLWSHKSPLLLSHLLIVDNFPKRTCRSNSLISLVKAHSRSIVFEVFTK